MNPDKISALIDCLDNLSFAQSSLDDVDDQDDPFIVKIHWAIKDIIDEITEEFE